MGRMFGRVDDEGDGFDDVELTRILNIVSGLPLCRSASNKQHRLETAGSLIWSFAVSLGEISAIMAPVACFFADLHVVASV